MAASEIGVLQSVQVGTPRRHAVETPGRARRARWESSFVREPSPLPRWLHTTHLDGNEQADKANHGREGQAVLLYAAAHYPLWRAELDLAEIGPGGFAENFTVAGLSEESVCLGDVQAIGGAVIEVSGPRYPCWKIERRWGIDGLTARVAATGRTGWYARVLREGLVTPGDPIDLVARPYPHCSMALLNDLGHGRSTDRATAETLAAIPMLPPFWAKLILRRAGGEADADG